MAVTTLDLTGIWQFKEYPTYARRMRDLEPAHPRAGWLDTPVPSSIYSSLIHAGRIDPADLDANPEAYQGLSDNPWVYRKVFDVPADLLECPRKHLVFEGLDTIAGIWLNEKLVARTDNMFIGHRFDITDLLKPAGNVLLVKFEPPVKHAQRLMKRHAAFTNAGFSNPHRVYIRKAQYQFGWDFAPTLPGCGIWRPVRIEGLHAARIADVHIRTIDLAEKTADLRIAVTLDAVEDTDLICTLAVTGPGFATACDLSFSPGQHTHSTVIHVPSPHLWWPNGHGGQPLYILDLELKTRRRTIDRHTAKFGIRTIRLQCPVADPGARHDAEPAFQFIVNGRPIRVRGANWTPASMHPGDLTDARYEALLHAARDAHMNMLRVWGGGYYESDRFYDLCDELGLLVWQDFMFACAYYPDRQWFGDQVQAEAVRTIERLRNHPCLALWCGNNEIDWLHAIGQLGKGRKFYGKAIFHQILPRLVAQLDGDTSYIPTTPLATGDGFLPLQDFHSDLAAARRREKPAPRPLTTHRWDVWSGCRPVRRYLCPAEDVPAFVTEFGLQAPPAAATIRRFGTDLRIQSPTFEKHNYQIDGNARLHAYTAAGFAPTADLDRFAYHAQLTQARSVKQYVEFLRIHNRRNSGVLFWQFNEPAPAISWSAVDVDGRPKALYYYARRFYAPVLVTIVPCLDEPTTGLARPLRPEAVVVVNDSPATITATLEARLLHLTGRLLDRITFPVLVGPFSVSTPLKLPRALVTPDASRCCALHLLLKQDDTAIARNLFLYVPDKHIQWPPANISAHTERLTDTVWEVALTADAVAKDLRITSEPPAAFSDNFLDVIPPRPAKIHVTYPPEGTTEAPVLTFRSVTNP
ncbi:MAG TPA: glycoside hydrolase family 2 protein [Phycisphaerales bacterium]|nr:glycoside hydrolase family 2 protein [Phycisphaerales bacterium]